MALAVAPLLGLVLAGCGGGDDTESSAATTTTASVDAETSAAAVPTPKSTVRFDISAVMVCGVVETTLAQGANGTKLASQLVESLEAAFDGSSTPNATIRSAKVDALMNDGCPALRAQVLESSGVPTMAELAEEPS
ncbi:hypothetical protein JCM9957A_07070 [Kineosporia succinea]